MVKNDMVTQIEKQLRPCVVTIPEVTIPKNLKGGGYESVVVREAKKHNALFHRWHESFGTIGKSPLVGGPSSALFGVVEYEDGTVHQVNAEWIQFIDGLINDFDFSESDGNNED